MKIRNHDQLSKWPPDWGGSYGKDDTFQIGEEGGTLSSATLVNDHIDIVVEFDRKKVFGQIRSNNHHVLKSVVEILMKNLGKPLKEIGDLEVPEV